MVNNKGIAGITLILIIGLIIGGSYIAVQTGIIKNLSSLIQEALPSTGAQFIKNDVDPSSPYTTIIKGPSFTCDVDQCIVSGSMLVDKGVGVTKYGCDNVVNPKLFDSHSMCQGAFDRGCTKQHCVLLTNIKYDATYNFCPSNNQEFAYCKGTTNQITSNEPSTYFTEEVKLLSGQVINFNPKNSDGSDIIERYIRIKKYDLSCIPAIQDGTACIPGQISCKNQNACPSGYELITQLAPNIPYYDCALNPYENIDRRLDNNDLKKWPICRTIGAHYTNNAVCLLPSSSTFKEYLKCEAKQTIGNSQCDAFGTTIYTAPTGQECFLLDSSGKLTTQHGDGLGGLACPGDTCALGSRSGVDGGKTYSECVQIGQCNVLQENIACPEGLVFRTETNKCGIAKEKSCSPNEAECISSDSIRKCEAVSISGVNGYQWSTTNVCAGELQCDDKGDNIFNDVCSCNGVSETKTSTYQCISTTRYKEYARDPSNPDTTCFAYRDLGGTITDPSLECKNGEIVQKAGLDCSNLASLACSTEKDSSGKLLETCQSVFGTSTKQCLTNPLITNIAAEADFNAGVTKCGTNNEILKIVKYSTTSSNYYLYEINKDATDTNDGICKQDLFCIEQLSFPSKATCVSGFKDAIILGKSNFGINENIGNLTLKVDSEVIDPKNQPVVAQLYDDINDNNIVDEQGELLKRIDRLTNNIGEASLDFQYKHPRKGKLKILVTTGDPKNINVKTSKTIFIEKILDVKLNCPSNGFINRDIECSWRIEDSETKQLLVATIKVDVTQGGVINFDTVGNDKIRFKSDILGGVIVKVSATKQDYLPDSDELIITIQDTVITQTLTVDNQDYSIIGSSLDTGIRQIKLNVNEAGIPAIIQSIDASLIEPSGREVPLTFTKQSDGIWTTSANLELPGTRYLLKGNINPVDITQSIIPFEYAMVTLGAGGTEADKATNTIIFIIVGGIVLLLVIIILVVFLTRGKKGRK